MLKPMLTVVDVHNGSKPTFAEQFRVSDQGQVRVGGDYTNSYNIVNLGTGFTDMALLGC